jgi:uncharacterized protein YndB with AHSA1/START domain
MTNPIPASRSVLIERLIPHPPGKIWRALTQGHLIAEWLMPNDFQPLVGHRFNFRTTPMPHWDGVVDCEVLAVEPNDTLAYSWGSAGGLQSVVTWTLTPANGGTLVRMEQTGFGPDDTANYQGATYGWQRFFSGLERVIGGLED